MLALVVNENALNHGRSGDLIFIASRARSYSYMERA